MRRDLPLSPAIWLVVTFALGACDRDPKPATTLASAASTPRVGAPLILAALIDALGLPPGANVITIREVVVDSTGWLTGDRTLEWVTANLPGVRQETLDAFRRAVVTAGDARTLYADNENIKWSPMPLAEDFNPSDNRTWYVRLSRIGFSPDSTQALLYATVVCGGLCGRGEYFLLERTPHNTWKIRSRLLRVIS